MVQATVSEEQFIELWNKHQSATKLAEELGINVRNVLARRARIEGKRGITLLATSTQRGHKKHHYILPEDRIRTNLFMEDGLIVVGSDCHYWPGYISTAHRAFVKIVKDLKPQAVVLNGDIMDNATISAHHRIGYADSPTVKEELDEVQARLAEIESVSGNAILHRTIGNHDLRFDGKLSNILPQYEGVKGFALADHLPAWKYSWSIMVNNNTMIKHRWHNGIHAQYNNVLKGGVSMVTGHLHSLKVTPWTDYTGDKYGVDTGTMAALGGDKWEYLEDTSVNWRSGFAVLTFRNGQLMPPELVQVIDEDEGLAFFRGEVFKV